MNSTARLTVAVERMGQSGDGVGTLEDGRVVFVPGALPGETVQIEVTEERKNFARARVISRVTSSPERTSPVCPVYWECGGCSFQHWDYQAELAHKERSVGDSLTRIGHLAEIPIRPILGAANPYGYRNKGLFPWARDPAGRPVAGLYARNSHRVVATSVCAIQDRLINEVLAACTRLAQTHRLSVYDGKSPRGLLRHLLVRTSSESRHALVGFVATDRDPRLEAAAQELMREVPGVSGVVVNINRDQTNRVLGASTELLAGTPYLIDSILGQRFRISANTFFQINPAQVNVLYQTVLDALPEYSDEVWDLYAGVATLACLIAPRAASIVAVEVNRDSIADAKANLTLNSLNNVSLVEAAVEDLLRSERWANASPATIVLDPPRSGLHPDVTSFLLARTVPRLIYVSCNPNTLARDLQALNPKYRTEWVQPVDMFPRTDHVEAVASMVLA